MKYTIMYRMNQDSRRMEAFLLETPEDGQRLSSYARYGWHQAGTVETELSRDDLIQGLAVRIIEERDRANSRLQRIQDLVGGIDRDALRRAT